MSSSEDAFKPHASNISVGEEIFIKKSLIFVRIEFPVINFDVNFESVIGLFSFKLC